MQHIIFNLHHIFIGDLNHQTRGCQLDLLQG